MALSGVDPAPSTGSRTVSPWRSVALPTEHGGWGFTLEPIILGLIAIPSAAGWEIAAAALGVFLARRPMKLLSTDVVRRRWLPRTTRALLFALLYGGFAAAGVGGAMFTAAGAWWSPILVAAPLAGFALYADAHSHNRKLPAELAGSIAMGATVSAIALGGGWGAVPAFGLWLVLAARDIATIVLVRGQVRRLKGKPVGVGAIYVVQVAVIAGIILAASWDVVPILGAVAIAMVGVVALVSLNRPPVPARVVGWTQMGVGLMVALLTGAGARLGW